VDNDRHGIRASGNYAKYNGRVYFARKIRVGVWVFSDDDPLPQGFESSSKDWINGEVLVPFDDIEGLVKVRTTCTWRGHHFKVGIIVGDSANITYLGNDFDAVGGLPGMWRPDKFEVKGKVPVSELTDIKEHVEEVPLGDRSSSGTSKGAE
jgi:hypothetical protein